MFTKLKPIVLLILIISLAFIFVSVEGFNAAAEPNRPTDDSYVFLPIIIAPPASVPFGAEFSGEGTWYNATGEGNCIFPASPENMMVAAMNHVQYADSALCGAYAQVTGPNGAIIVRIVDQCPGCLVGDIDLSQEAFAKIANLADGRVPISWQLVSYPLPDPIVYHFKDGSNQWWTAVQIRNHSNPVVSVEYWDGGAFHEIPRYSYNYFVATSGLGPGPYTFRVTDYFGNQLVDNGIPHVENGDVVGGGQFPQP
ncbi:MAG: hypothetical protein GY803_06495 [Chloroflexi bacterium]|nr:hypothetical protein [Chloroflexota bacterium]